CALASKASSPRCSFKSITSSACTATGLSRNSRVSPPRTRERSEIKSTMPEQSLAGLSRTEPYNPTDCPWESASPKPLHGFQENELGRQGAAIRRGIIKLTAQSIAVKVSHDH